MKPTRRPEVARRRRARHSLSRDEILDAAVALAETEGLNQLSMPALARRLQCAAMSIYKYFRNKDDLLDALAHRVVHDLHGRLPPVGDGPWNVELVAYFVAVRERMENFAAWREIVLYAPTAAVRAVLGDDATRWRDPAWQRQVGRELAALGIDVALVVKGAGQGGLVFATGGARQWMGAAGGRAAASASSGNVSSLRATIVTE